MRIEHSTEALFAYLPESLDLLAGFFLFGAGILHSIYRRRRISASLNQERLDLERTDGEGYAVRTRYSQTGRVTSNLLEGQLQISRRTTKVQDAPFASDKSKGPSSARCRSVVGHWKELASYPLELNEEPRHDGEETREHQNLGKPRSRSRFPFLRTSVEELSERRDGPRTSQARLALCLRKLG